MPNVFDYFTEKLGAEPTDATLKELPVDSGCGDDCIKAIDAAAAFKAVSDTANPAIAESIIAAADHTVQVFWRG